MPKRLPTRLQTPQQRAAYAREDKEKFLKQQQEALNKAPPPQPTFVDREFKKHRPPMRDHMRL